ncbi:MAG: tetratricopeptide repeat protein [Candidatus Obscuribacterales bacterium]
MNTDGSHYERARTLHSIGRDREAEREIQLFIAEYPEDADAQILLGFILTAQGKYGPAVEAGRAAVRLNPENYLSHYVLAEAHVHQKQLNEAEAAIKEALRLNPQEAANHGTYAYVARAREQWDETLTRARAGLAVDPRHLRSLSMASIALIELKRHDEAEVFLDQALAINPEHDYLHINKGICAFARGENEKGLDFFLEALRLNPTSTNAQQNLLQVLQNRNPLFNALRAFVLAAIVAIGAVVAVPVIVLAPIFMLFNMLAPTWADTAVDKDKKFGLFELLAFLSALVLAPFWLLLLGGTKLLELTRQSLLSAALLVDPIGKRLVLPEDRSRMLRCAVIWVSLITLAVYVGFGTYNAHFRTPHS